MPPKKPQSRHYATKKVAATGSVPSVTFAGLLKPLVPPSARPLTKVTVQSAPLSHLEYKAELRFKDEALALFWQEHRLPGKPQPVIASPRPRGYRTTSKRKAYLRGSSLYLLFGEKGLQDQKKPFLSSPLEPAEHGIIYTFLQRRLSEPAFRLVAGHLNYLIIRGSYTERAVIFNVDMLNGPLVRKLKIVASHLQNLEAPVTAAYIYLDPSGSDYYLESRRPAETLDFKKLFGPDMLSVSFDGVRYRFPPTSFSQVNESMVEIMLHQARELLAPGPAESLLDLYCGYGLFSHFMAPDYRQVVGIDAEGPSIRAAMANSRLNRNHGKIRFLGRKITAGFLDDDLPLSSAQEVVLLDPPRQGPQNGVIAALCRRRPQKVLHIFCGVDQIPAAFKEWQAGGYQVRHIVPLDMFPGSANLEVLVLLSS